MNSPLVSPDCSPLDFSVWERLASAVCDSESKNRQELVDRINNRWNSILDKNYLIKTCNAAWNRLRRVVGANGSYLKPTNEGVEDL